MRGIDTERAVRLVEAIVDVYHNTSSFWEDSERQLATESRLAAELKTFPVPDLLRCATGQGDLLIEVAADHLMAFARIVEEPVQTLAPYSCVRVVLESSTLAAWLFEPEISCIARVERSLALRLEGLNQQLRFVESVATEEDVQRVAYRIETLKADALLGGLEIAKATMPKITALTNSIMNKEHVYRLLSSVVHAHHWAVQQLGFGIVSDQAGDGLVALTKRLNPAALIYLCIQAAEPFGVALLRKAALLGWDVVHLRREIMAPFEEVGVTLNLARG